MPLDMGPVQFQIVGTFTEKPRLILNGEEVPYETLHASYCPAETYEYEDMDGNKVKEEYPEHIALAFSLKSQIGQLEANVSYRVKANSNESFVLEKVPAEEAYPGKKDKKAEKKEEKEKTESPKKKKGKSLKLSLSGVRGLKPDAGTRMHRKNVNEDILRNLVTEDE